MWFLFQNVFLENNRRLNQSYAEHKSPLENIVENQFSVYLLHIGILRNVNIGSTFESINDCFSKPFPWKKNPKRQDINTSQLLVLFLVFLIWTFITHSQCFALNFHLRQKDGSKELNFCGLQCNIWVDKKNITLLYKCQITYQNLHEY